MSHPTIINVADDEENNEEIEKMDEVSSLFFDEMLGAFDLYVETMGVPLNNYRVQRDELDSLLLEVYADIVEIHGRENLPLKRKEENGEDVISDDEDDDEDEENEDEYNVVDNAIAMANQLHNRKADYDDRGWAYNKNKRRFTKTLGEKKVVSGHKK